MVKPEFHCLDLCFLPMGLSLKRLQTSQEGVKNPQDPDSELQTISLNLREKCTHPMVHPAPHRTQDASGVDQVLSQGLWDGIAQAITPSSAAQVLSWVQEDVGNY